MQLKFQRSQRAGGVVGMTVNFCLDARAGIIGIVDAYADHSAVGDLKAHRKHFAAHLT